MGRGAELKMRSGDPAERKEEVGHYLKRRTQRRRKTNVRRTSGKGSIKGVTQPSLLERKEYRKKAPKSFGNAGGEGKNDVGEKEEEQVVRLRTASTQSEIKGGEAKQGASGKKI